MSEHKKLNTECIIPEKIKCIYYIIKTLSDHIINYETAMKNIPNETQKTGSDKYG